MPKEDDSIGTSGVKVCGDFGLSCLLTPEVHKMFAHNITVHCYRTEGYKILIERGKASKWSANAFGRRAEFSGTSD